MCACAWHRGLETVEDKRTHRLKRLRMMCADVCDAAGRAGKLAAGRARKLAGVVGETTGGCTGVCGTGKKGAETRSRASGLSIPVRPQGDGGGLCAGPDPCAWTCVVMG